MCLVTFALGSSATYPLVFAANRDELHTRPTAEADWWPEPASILGGRDLLAGGSWLAVDRRGRLAAVTNIPSDEIRENARSRGDLVVILLQSLRVLRPFQASSIRCTRNS